MPETPTAAELEIPDASGIAWCQGVPDPVPAFVEEDVRAIAAPVVAAELRRIAATAAPNQTTDDPQEQAYWDGLDEMADRLLARADELDPPAQEA